MAHKVYIVGIEGAGTSALAQIYKARGYDVVGSDEGDGFYRANLERVGVVVHTTFAADNITEDISFAVHSTAYDETHVEMQALAAQSIRTLSYPEAIGLLTREMETIAVCGTHGKTTTTGMLGHALIAAEFAPTVLVGAPVAGWGGGAYTGYGSLFVVEADEYQNKLRHYTPHGVVLTSVDYDHPDFFADEAAYTQVFIDFVARIPEDGFLVAYADDAVVRSVARSASCRVIFYGTSDKSDVQITQRAIVEGAQEITFAEGGNTHTMRIAQIGEHNALNAVAAWAATRTFTHITTHVIQDGVSAYRGVARRLEHKGNFNGALLLDDYAHHPREVETTLAGIREGYPERRLIAAFHPHTFTRTAALMQDFALAFGDADQVIILDIYGSAREVSGGVDAEDLVAAINAHTPERAIHISNIDMLAAWAREHLTETDLFITLGAGDIYKVHTVLRA